MTIEEIETLLYDLEAWQKDAENCEIIPPNVFRKCKYAIKTLLGYSEYRWHDLRKIPDDLPPKDEVVIAAIQYSWGDTSYRTLIRNSYIWEDNHVLAWAYITPFNEREKDRTNVW